ncbi:NAP1-related protein 2 [Cucumis melo var. makuwa]|uniref:NAP1-related protein 2 n=1 Tax=Cucumis melo var. makuwa TaxID=1194695 RepID=A0A5A7T071_CUCMM|nr:NAP1-related protein 2 [Cucumis melo var. makuwa]
MSKSGSVGLKEQDVVSGMDRNISIVWGVQLRDFSGMTRPLGSPASSYGINLEQHVGIIRIVRISCHHHHQHTSDSSIPVVVVSFFHPFLNIAHKPRDLGPILHKNPSEHRYLVGTSLPCRKIRAVCSLQIFRHLDSLGVEDQKDVKMGYSIMFSFNENPYFEDRKLEKTYTFFEDGAIKITGTTIKWKDGSGASNGVNGEKKGKKRPLTEDRCFLTPSFFIPSILNKVIGPEGLTMTLVLLGNRA